MQVSARRPLHRDTVHSVEFEITKRLKGIAGPVPVITGQPGSGKTSLLRHIQTHQQSLGRFVGIGEVRNGLETAVIAATRQIITDLTRLDAPRLNAAPIIESLTTALTRYLRAFASDLSVDERTRQNDALLVEIADASSRLPNGILLLLDDIDTDDAYQVLAFTDAVLALAETGSPLLVVATSSTDRRDSRWPRSQKPFRILPTLTDIIELAHALGFDVTRDELHIVADQCKGNLYEATNRLRALATHRNPLAHQHHSGSSQLTPQLTPQPAAQPAHVPAPATAPVSVPVSTPVAAAIPSLPTRPLPTRTKSNNEKLADRIPGQSRATSQSTESKFKEVAETSRRLPADTGPLDPFRSLRNSERRQSLQNRDTTTPAPVPPIPQATTPLAKRPQLPPPSEEKPFGDEAQIASLRAALTHLSDVENEADVSLRGQTFKRLGE